VHRGSYTIFGCCLVLFIAGPGVSKCFDFEKNLTEPLQSPIASVAGTDVTKIGSLENGVQWGAVRGVAKKPIREIIEKFSDPYLTKNRKTTKITAQPLKNPRYLWERAMTLVVKPVFFVTIEWEEQWALKIREGTRDAPKSAIVYYQKTAGTSHLEHLCGNILLSARDSASTDVYLYEEVKASRWTNEDAVRNFLVVLKILRDEYKDE
jgi:hypothetical protein